MLALAPGGMRSAASFWERVPWNPVTELADGHQVIVMDQRNAGASSAPVTGTENWTTYTADQLALLDHLGVERFAVVGMCIGGPFVLGLLQAAPTRVAGAVVIQSIGLDGNRAAFHEMFDGWAVDIAPDHPEAGPGTWAAYRSGMYDGDDALSASPPRSCRPSPRPSSSCRVTTATTRAARPGSSPTRCRARRSSSTGRTRRSPTRARGSSSSWLRFVHDTGHAGRKNGSMTWDDVVTIAGGLPEVEVSTSYGTPALKVRRKLFARLRSDAEGAVVLMCQMDEKEALLASGDPAFFTTPHYDGYGAILVDLDKVAPDQLAELVEEAWRHRAPARLRDTYDSTRPR